MEIYLNCGSEQIRFPVLPPSIGINSGASISNESVIKLGEVSVWNGPSLKTVEFESFFPNKEYPFCQYRGFMKPYEFSSKIQKFMDQGMVCRIIVTNSPINMECYIESFKVWEQDGTGDVYFNIALIEFRKPKLTGTR